MYYATVSSQVLRSRGRPRKHGCGVCGGPWRTYTSGRRVCPRCHSKLNTTHNRKQALLFRISLYDALLVRSDSDIRGHAKAVSALFELEVTSFLLKSLHRLLSLTSSGAPFRFESSKEIAVRTELVDLSGEYLIRADSDPYYPISDLQVPDLDGLGEWIFENTRDGNPVVLCL